MGYILLFKWAEHTEELMKYHMKTEKKTPYEITALVGRLSLSVGWEHGPE